MRPLNTFEVILNFMKNSRLYVFIIYRCVHQYWLKILCARKIYLKSGSDGTKEFLNDM